MEKNIKNIIILGLLAVVYSCSSEQISHKKSVINKSEIETISAYKNEYNSLINKTDRTIKKKFKNITDKEIAAPSGDKHDYYSRAIYYWPDSTGSHKKWKFIDGKVNRKSLEETDHFTFFEAMGAIRDLSLAFHLSNNENYAVKAFQIIDQWFVSNNTKMNPNFKYAQAIPGKSDGTHWGIISSRAIVWVINSIELLKSSHSFDDDVYEEFNNWCLHFLEWLTLSEFGQKEGATKNNHATFYALQVAELANFTHETELCENTLNRVMNTLIPEQIKSDGSMPAELKRTRPVHYSLFNLSAFFHLARLGDKYNLNMWEVRTDTSSSILDAFNFTLEQIDNVNKTDEKDIISSYVIGLLTIANSKFKEQYNNQLYKMLSKNKKMRLVDSYFPF